MEKDMIIIAERLRARLVTQDLAPDAVRDLLRNQQEDGRWPDVDYDDPSRTHWKPMLHLSYLQRLSFAYCATGDGKIRDAFLAGLRFWVTRDPQSDNWWFNVIGAPRSLSDMLLLMIDHVPPDLVDRTAACIHRSGFTRTGANLVDEASNLLTLACATGNATLLREAIEHIASEVRITTEEGIQQDDSFYQHGPQNMVISYGRGFAADQAGFAALFAGTSFAYSKEQIRILSRFILDGQQWYIWGRQVDFHAMGRGAFRGGPGVHVWNAGGFEETCRLMAAADPDRAAEYGAFADRVAGRQPAGASGPLGNKHFWRSDTMVHRDKDWYVSVRFHSTRTYATETRTNRENLKGYHLSDGAYYLLRRGDEYHDIQPVWDYRKLPGLTFLETDAPLPYGQDAPRGGNTAFVGGASDGLCGVSAMDYDKGGVRAKKGYFFGDDGFVCLGAGIASGEKERVCTTLNQCLLKSDVALLRGGAVETLDTSRTEAKDIRAIHHDGVAYVLLAGAAMVVQAKRQEGSWQEVEAKASADAVVQDVFSCWVDHGAGPNHGSYAYYVVPGVNRDALAAQAADPGVRMLSNTAALQGVCWERAGVAQVIFHVPGALSVPDWGLVRVDMPCAAMLRTAGGANLLTVADPTQTGVHLIVEIEGRYTGQGASYVPDGDMTRVVVDLPQGPHAGRSVQVLLHRE